MARRCDSPTDASQLEELREALDVLLKPNLDLSTNPGVDYYYPRFDGHNNDLYTGAPMTALKRELSPRMYEVVKALRQVPNDPQSKTPIRISNNPPSRIIFKRGARADDDGIRTSMRNSPIYLRMVGDNE